MLKSLVSRPHQLVVHLCCSTAPRARFLRSQFPCRIRFRLAPCALVLVWELVRHSSSSQRMVSWQKSRLWRFADRQRPARASGEGTSASSASVWLPAGCRCFAIWTGRQQQLVHGIWTETETMEQQRQAPEARILEPWELEKRTCPAPKAMTHNVQGESQLRCFHCLRPIIAGRPQPEEPQSFYSVEGSSAKEPAAVEQPAAVEKPAAVKQTAAHGAARGR